MLRTSTTALAEAAETRRRELPASIALTILTGGIAAAIMDGGEAVGWAAIMALLLVLDAELYRRLDAGRRALDGKVIAGLAAWSFLSAAFYAVLPLSLWLDGQAAGAAAAMVLWVAGVVRHFSPGVSGAWPIALAGAAPPALSLLVSPVLMAAASARTDWDLAVIAAIGGGALMAYVTQARMSAAEAERALRGLKAQMSCDDLLGALLMQDREALLVLMDREGRVVAASKGVRVRLARDDIAGRRLDEVAALPPEAWSKTFAAALGGESLKYSEYELRLPSGRHWFDWEVQPWRDEEGEIKGVLAIARDVTDRKQREAAFIASMRRAEAVLKAKRILLGEEPDDASEAFADVGIEKMHERLEALMEEMNARDAMLAQTMQSLRDAREAAEAASVSKSQFLASMSHELRTPLNAIIGYSEILQEEAEADGRDTDLADIERVLLSARQLLHLINDILDLSKIEAGRMEVSAAEFDVARLIEDAAATILPSIEKGANALKLDIADDLGQACTDAFKLNQCLLNLLSNAAKFTQGGAVTVRARRLARDGRDWLEISVADTGIGLTKEQMSKLFADFVQAEASTARRFGGTGLGLAITRRMLQLLGGDVSVESEPGKGAIFTITAPALLAAAETPLPAPAAAAAADGASRTVLLIDDEASARDLVGRSLTRLGFSILNAGRGEEGLAHAAAARPHLIVLDINLPDMSGWDVLAALGAEARTRDIPVLILSVDDNRARARAAGACELLLKPADREVLAAAALRFARAPELAEPAAPAQPNRIAKSA